MTGHQPHRAQLYRRVQGSALWPPPLLLPQGGPALEQGTGGDIYNIYTRYPIYLHYLRYLLLFITTRNKNIFFRYFQ